mgnify:CR=1 FL=1
MSLNPDRVAAAVSFCAVTNPYARFVIYDDRGHTLSRPPEVEQKIRELHNGKKTNLKSENAIASIFAVWLTEISPYLSPLLKSNGLPLSA